MKYLTLALFTVLLIGCVPFKYERTAPDGTHTTVAASFPFWSNSALRGVNIDSSTKTTTNGFRMTSANVDPNVESITATGAALGELIGTAAAVGAKGVKP